jgi:uncharacterized repeat protein (TIGR02543 family)
MFKQLMKIMLMLSVMCGASGAPYGGWLSGAEAQAAIITLPKTGQTKCYDPSGTTPNEIPCAGTGQDADTLKGADWPVPRFIANMKSDGVTSNGTVTDDLTGLIWLKDAGCNSTVNGIPKGNTPATSFLLWPDAITWSNNLKGDNSACSLNDGSLAGDWRLPNRKELQSLIDRQIPITSAFPADQPFSNVRHSQYWSSTTFYQGSTPYYAWDVSVGGVVNYHTIVNTPKYVWPVRGGQFGDSVSSVLPSVKDFGSVAVVSANPNQTFTISNSGAASRLHINAMVLSGTDAGLFTLNVGDGTAGSCGSKTPIIAPGGSCTLSVTFTPGSIGAKSASLRISGSDVNTPNVDIALSGTGRDFIIGTSVTGGNGTITCTTPIASGGTSDCTISNITAGYHLATFTDNTLDKLASVSANAYSITNVTADHTVAGTFALDGVCGSSNRSPLTVAPASALCTFGTASAVNGSGPWTWSCGGDNGGSTAYCSAYVQGTVLIPKTGQTNCYDISNGTIACAGTGQDGEKQAGAAQTDPLFIDDGNGRITDKVYGMQWFKDVLSNGGGSQTGIVGVPAIRFTNNDDGTQTDNLTGLVWLKDLSCFASPQDWATALTSANTLKGDNSQCNLNDGSVAGDWRLPNINELASVATNWTGNNVAAWLNALGFNVLAGNYWSSSSTLVAGNAWSWDGLSGGSGLGTKGDAGHYVWPVRGGQMGSLGTLTIYKSGTGTGIISSTPDGITCGGTCSASFAKGQAVVLTATAVSGSALADWTGCDSVDGNNKCTVGASGAKSVTARLEPTYTVTYNANGGSGTMTDASSPYLSGATVTVLANSFTRSGYTFAGWYPAADGSGTAYGASFTMGSANTTLYAQWTINSYSVTFDSNTGSGTMSSQSANYNVATNLTANSFTKTGYTFAGWNTLANGSGTAYAEGASYPFTASTTLYAQWTINSYSVTFDSNTGSGTMSSQSANYSTATALTTNSFTKTGYTFAGWNTAADGTGSAYAAGASYPFTASVTLYAQWTINNYTVTFDSNTGSGTMNNQSANYNVATALTANSFTKTGYTFAGWNTLADGSGSAYAAGASYPFTASTTLYAQWTINSYTVTFDSNTGSGTMSTQSATYNVATALNANSFTKTGYTFAGWNTLANGSGSAYAAGASYPFTASDTLYAQWTINSYTVTFDSNTGSGTMNNQSANYNVATALTANSFTKTGYTFAGWNTLANGSGSAYAAGASYQFTASTTLYAQWTINSYTVTFDSNTGSGSMSTQSATYNVATALNANSFTKTGYTFAGWNTLADGSGSAYTAGASYPFTASVTLYAQWTINSYSVTFDANTGSGTMSNQSANYNVATNLTATSFIKTGCTFAGWNTLANGSGTSYTNGASYPFTASTTLYAQWTINSYSVTFDANTGSGTMSNQSANYNVATNLTATSFIKTGCTFAGWNTLANGSGTSYSNGASYPFTASTTLYAQWTINSYTVTFDSNTGSGTMNNQSANYNVATALNANSFTKTGYTFAGWNTQANGSGSAYAAGASYPFTSSVTLYAQWSINSYSVIFNSNGGSVVTSQTVAYNSTATAPTAPTKTGYTFTGWYSDASLTSAFDFTTSITAATTLYAKWTAVVPNTFTVTPTAGTGSSITPATAQTVTSGTTTSFTIAPGSGYGILSVTGCNGTLNSTTYTTGAIVANCAVTVTAIKRNGNSGTATDPSIGDALKALQAYSGAVSLTAEEKIRYDVAPLAVNGVPEGNSVVDFADVIMILRRSIGIGSW